MRRNPKKLQTIRPLTTASLRSKTYDLRFGVRGRSDPHPKSRTRIPPILWKFRSRPQWAMGCLRYAEIGTLCSRAQR